MQLFVPDTCAHTFLNQTLSLICNFPFQTTLLNHTGVCTSITTAICKEETGNAAAAVWWQRMQEDSWRPLMMLVEVEVCWCAVQCTPLYTLWSDLELLCLQQAR